MFKGERITFRDTKGEDLPRLDEFVQGVELYRLDCGYPTAHSIEQARADYESWSKPDPHQAFFTIEVDGKYIGDLIK